MVIILINKIILQMIHILILQLRNTSKSQQSTKQKLPQFQKDIQSYNAPNYRKKK